MRRSRGLGRSGPTQDTDQGAGKDLDTPQPRQLSQPWQAGLYDGLRRGILAGNEQSNFCSKDIFKKPRVAGKVCFEMFQDLATEQGCLPNQVVATASPELERAVDDVPGGILKPKAVDRGSADSPQVGVVGLVIVGSGLAKMAGDRGVNDAGLKASTSESSQYWQVIATGALDDDDQIFQAIASDGLAENSDGFVESGPIVFDDRGRDEGAAVEVGHHPLRAGLGAVNGDDAEVLGTDFLNPWRKDAGWIAELAEFTRTTGGAAIFAWTHGWILRDGVDDRTNTIWESHWQQSRRDSSLKELLPDISQLV